MRRSLPPGKTMLATGVETPPPAMHGEAEPLRSDLKTGEMRAEKTEEDHDYLTPRSLLHPAPTGSSG